MRAETGGLSGRNRLNSRAAGNDFTGRRDRREECRGRWAERHEAHRGIGVSAVISGNLLAAAVSLPFALPLPQASAGEWATIVYLGVFQIGLAYVFLTSAMRHLPALEVSLLLLLEPVLNPAWTWLVRGERPGTWTIVGGAVIVIATAIKTIYDARVPIASAATSAHSA